MLLLLIGAGWSEASLFSDLLQLSGVYKEGDRRPSPSVSNSAASVSLSNEKLVDEAEEKASDDNAVVFIDIISDRSDSVASNIVPYPSPEVLGFPQIESFATNFQKSIEWRNRKKRSADANAKADAKAEADANAEASAEAEAVAEADAESKADADADSKAGASLLPGHNPHHMIHHAPQVLPHPGQLPPAPGVSAAHLPLFPPLDQPLHIDEHGHIHMMPQSHLPPPPPPAHHASLGLPTPVPHGGHHVTISTPTHHVSHGVLDHGTHHAVHKEHHQVHGHETHAALHHPVHHAQVHHPAPVHHHVPVHHEPVVVAKVVSHKPSGYPKPAYGGSLEEIFGVGSRYHEPEPAYHAPEPAYHAPEPAYHAPEPAYHAPEPAYHAPEPAYHAPEPAYHAPSKPYTPDYSHPTGDYVSPYAKMKGHPFSLEHVFGIEMPLYYQSKYPHMSHMLHHHVQGHDPVPVYVPEPDYNHPVSGYPKPKHGASLEEIFGVATKYGAPKPAYHAPEPAYHAPEPKKEYILPEVKPAYHAPEPAYHAPEPAYHAPEPAYHAPEPAYHAPEPAYHAPKPAYHAPEPAYHAPEPAYHAPEPDYHYMMLMQPPVKHYIAPKKPSYKAPKSGYGYEAPHKGGSLEEIFGLGHHGPSYAAPTPAYAPPAPAYHAPKPSYSPPKLDYLVPKPAYEAPKPAYHPEPAYAPPTPSYKPKSGYGYAPPNDGGSLEDVFGIVKALPDRLYATPRPDYHPTTYKPKMPDYLHKGDPGYVLHYLPYEDYKPHHPESIAHGPPVPHAPGAAHILVPGTHVLPELRMPHPPHIKSLHHGARSKRSPVPGRTTFLFVFKT